MRIILIDDEPLICEYIKECIRQCGENYDVVGCFCRAKDALAYLRENPVDVVITDITMPEMDGLTLSGEIQERFGTDVAVVVLTCHRNFDFVRQAMACSVKEYVMKSEIDPDSIKRVLDSVGNSRYNPSLKNLSEYHTQSQFLRSLLDGSKEMDIPKKQLREQGVSLTEGAYISAAFPYSSTALDQLCSYNEPRLINQLLFPNVASTRYIYAANIAAPTGAEATACANELGRYLSTHCDGYVGVSSPYYDLGQICKCFREANRLADLAFFGIKGTLAQENSISAAVRQDAFSIVNKAIYSLLNHLSNDYWEYMQALFDLVKDGDIIEPDYLCSLLSYIITSVNLGNVSELKTNRLRTARSFAELKEIYSDISDSLMKSQKTYSEPIEKAVKYLEAHYAETVSLEDIAQHVFLSKEYFCRRFKAEVGSNFTEYRLQIQMREAYKAIINTSKHISKIAENVGITNISYFSNAFKKQFGASPSEIRKNFAVPD